MRSKRLTKSPHSLIGRLPRMKPAAPSRAKASASALICLIRSSSSWVKVSTGSGGRTESLPM